MDKSVSNEDGEGAVDGGGVEVAAFLSAIMPNLQETLSWTGAVIPDSGVQE